MIARSAVADDFLITRIIYGVVTPVDNAVVITVYKTDVTGHQFDTSRYFVLIGCSGYFLFGLE